MTIKLPESVKSILQRFWDYGYEAYIVGGCVRDFCLGKKPQDYDIATSARPEETKALFQEYKILETGLQHGTVTLIMEGIPFEITTYRVDGDYFDHRRPSSVRFTKSLKEDLKRRDFTINAMAYYNGLFDYFGGMEDLRKKEIRCVGQPEQRFEEDGLRILRALRFASTLGFSIDGETKDAIIKKKEGLRKISRERIRDEWTKLLSGSAAEQILWEFQSVINVFLPGFRPCVFPDNIQEELLRFCFVLNETYGASGIGKSMEMMKELRYDRKSCRDMSLLLPFFDRPFHTDKIHVKQYMKRMGLNLTRKAALLKQQDIEEMIKEIACNHECYTLSDLCLKGEDVIRLGVRPGKEVGEVLQRLLDYVIENPSANTPELLTEYLQNKL